MALTVETGAGLPGANTYAIIAEADSYHADRGNADWASATEGAKEQALILATEYLDNRYYYRWKGYKKREAQSLEWPRSWVYDRNGWLLDSTEIPSRLKDATSEAALRSLSEALMPDITRDNMVKRNKVGPITVEYRDEAPTTKQFVKVDRLLRGLLLPANGIRIRRG